MNNVQTEIMFHGTSSVVLESLLEHGLDCGKGQRLSHIIVEGNPLEGHLASLEGTYCAACPETALDYAAKAAERFGGEPILVCLAVQPLDAVPDEDTMQELVSNWLMDMADIVGIDSFCKGFADQDGLDGLAQALNKAVEANLSPQASEGAVGAAAGFLKGMYDRIGEDEVRKAMADGGHALLSEFALAMTETEEGMLDYRRLMSALCEAYRGPSPYDGIEFHTVRIPAPVGLEGRTRIIGVGRADDVFEHFTGDTEGLERELADAGVCLPASQRAAI